MQCFLHSLLPDASIVNHIQSALSGFNREDGCTKQQLGLSKVEELVTHPISRQEQKRISRAVAFDSRLYSEDDSFVNRLSRRNNSLFFFRETSHHNSDVWFPVESTKPQPFRELPNSFVSCHDWTDRKFYGPSFSEFREREVIIIFRFPPWSLKSVLPSFRQIIVPFSFFCRIAIRDSNCL